jgi:hypothetical protein
MAALRAMTRAISVYSLTCRFSNDCCARAGFAAEADLAEHAAAALSDRAASTRATRI